MLRVVRFGAASAGPRGAPKKATGRANVPSKFHRPVRPKTWATLEDPGDTWGAGAGHFGRFNAMLAALQGTPSNAPNDLLDALSRSTQFRRFLRDRKVDIESLGAEPRREWIRQYLDGFFRNLHEHRSELAERALRAALTAHGVQIPKTVSAREALRQISAANRKRLGSRLGVETAHAGAAARRIQRAVRNLRLRALHFGNANQGDVTVPLSSAKQLQRLGLGQYALNTRPFNVRVGSSDNIFFSPIFTAKDAATGEPKTLAYGHFGLNAEYGYLRQHGWISAFVMYPEQVMRAKKVHRGEPAPSQRRELPSFPDPRRPLPRRLRNAIRELHRLDFTPADFEGLVHDVLIHRIHELRRSDHAKCEAVLRNLERGRDISRILSELVFIPMGFDHPETIEAEEFFEAKVPVALDRCNLIFVDRSRKT